MKTLEDLKQFYRHGLQMELQEVERQRINTLITVALIASVELTILVAIVFAVPAKDRIGTGIGVGVLCLILWGILTYVFSNRWRRVFKEKIVTRLVAEIDPGLTYDPKGKMAQHQFNESRLFETSRYNRYHGEDLVSGTLDGIPLSFSELRVQHHSGSGKNSSTTTIFQGLYLAALMPRPFEGFTAIVPNLQAQIKLSGMAGAFLQRMIEKFLPKHSGSKIEFDDPAFDAVFDVYADKPHEAEQILTPDMRARLLRLHEANQGKKGRSQMHTGVRVSFCENTVYIALPITGSWFEPKLFSTVKNYEVIRRFFDDFNRATEVVFDVEQGLAELPGDAL